MKYGPRSQSEERTIAKATAAVVANLEVFRRRTVTSEEIAQIIGAPLGSDRHEWAVRSLVAHGWLAPLPMRGTYEFLPAQSGPDRAGDPLTEAAAALKRFPGLRLQLVLGGAAFLGGFNERTPVRYTLIVPRQAPIQRGLARAYDLIRAAPSRFFGATPRDSVPVSGASRLLFDAALWPGRAGDLRDPGHWLRAALAKADISEILAFAQGLDSDRVTARAGYFAEAFGRPDIAATLADLHPKAAVRLGDPAEPLHARDTRFGMRDHLGVAGA
jgi:predicted transcriptional regulator of viral defense system